MNTLFKTEKFKAECKFLNKWIDKNKLYIFLPNDETKRIIFNIIYYKILVLCSDIWCNKYDNISDIIYFHKYYEPVIYLWRIICSDGNSFNEIPSILLFLSINNKNNNNEKKVNKKKINKFKEFKKLFKMLLYSENNIIKLLTPDNCRVYERFSL